MVCENFEKKPTTKKDWWRGSRCRPWVQTPVLKKKRTNLDHGDEEGVLSDHMEPVIYTGDRNCGWEARALGIAKVFFHAASIIRVTPHEMILSHLLNLSSLGLGERSISNLGAQGGVQKEWEKLSKGIN
jgi:hypothetical protein